MVSPNNIWHERESLIQAFGWYGALAILLAFSLVSFGILVPRSLPYQLLNLTGAAGIVSISLHKKDYQPAVLNIVWALVALAAILLILLGIPGF